MKITSLNQLNKRKLYDRLRPISPLYLSFLKEIESVIDGDNRRELHQCKCGNIVLMEKKEVEKKVKELKVKELPCATCGGYAVDIFKIDKHSKFFQITQKIRQYEKAPSIDKKRVFKELQSLCSAYFSNNNIHEIYYGYQNLLNLILFGRRKKSAIRKSLELFFDRAYKRSPTQLVNFIKSGKYQGAISESLFNLRIAENFIEFSEYLEKILDIEISLFESEESKRKYSILQELVAYNHMTELDWHYDVLHFALNIIQGRNMADPLFATQNQQSGRWSSIKYPIDKLNRLRRLGLERNSLNKQTGIVGIISYIMPLIDNELRNAIYHSQYSIKKDKILIKFFNPSSGRYVDHSRSITAVKRKIRRFEEFRSSLLSVLSEISIRHSVKKIKGMGCTEMKLTFDFSEEIPLIRFEYYVYWDSFYLLLKDSVVEFKQKLTINRRNKTITIKLNRLTFKTNINQGQIDKLSKHDGASTQIIFHIIAPDFPVFSDLKTGYIKTHSGEYMHIIGSCNLSDVEGTKKFFDRLQKKIRPIIDE